MHLKRFIVAALRKALHYVWVFISVIGEVKQLIEPVGYSQNIFCYCREIEQRFLLTRHEMIYHFYSFQDFDLLFSLELCK